MSWPKENADSKESDDKTKLISYSTGLIPEGKVGVNPEACFLVGTALLKEHDGMSFSPKFGLKGKVVNLSQLKKLTYNKWRGRGYKFTHNI